MAQIINLAAVLHDRRTKAEHERADAAAEQRRIDQRAALHAEYDDGGPAGRAFADIVADVLERARPTEQQPMPAYCDPDNERRGAKYDATRSLSLAEIARRIRADIKAALAGGAISAGLKISVRTRTYSGGGAIDVRLSGIPAGYTIWNAAYLRHETDHRNDGWHPFPGEIFSAEWSADRAALKSIHAAYNRDNSDAMTDYFDVRFYGDVGIDWRIERDLRRAETAIALTDREQHNG